MLLAAVLAQWALGNLFSLTANVETFDKAVPSNCWMNNLKFWLNSTGSHLS